jgi:hypothetical protein
MISLERNNFVVVVYSISNVFGNLRGAVNRRAAEEMVLDGVIVEVSTLQSDEIYTLKLKAEVYIRQILMTFNILKQCFILLS